MNTQCACIFAESVERIMEELGRLQNILPSIIEDFRMYPASRELKWKLRDVFDSYVAFCKTIARHWARNPACTSLVARPPLCPSTHLPKTMSISPPTPVPKGAANCWPCLYQGSLSRDWCSRP